MVYGISNKPPQDIGMYLGACIPVSGPPLFPLQVYKQPVSASAVPTAALLALRAMLRNDPRPHADDNDEPKNSVDYCIHARGKKYEVAVSWGNLDVMTCYTKSLERAIAWRAALTVLKQRAKRRLQQDSGNCHTLIEEEILDMLRMEPDLNVTFRAKCSAVNKATLQIANWQLTLSQQAELARAVALRGDVKKRVDKYLAKAKTRQGQEGH